MQYEPWEPPNTVLPMDLVAATVSLFEQGLPDPRGCEYREIEAAVRLFENEGTDVRRTVGWVLPDDTGAGDRLAICLNGLVHPVAEVGPRADPATLVREMQAYSPDGAPPSRFCFLWAVLLLRSGEPRLAADVWSLIPSTVLRQSGLPATPGDVAEGRAIFSLEAEGEARVWRMPECPLVALWRPEGAPAPLPGFVWQAEEVNRDGIRERFYGFDRDGPHRVPAKEIEFRSPLSQWGELADGLGARLVLPDEDRRTGPVFFPGEQVIASLRIRNQRGTSFEAQREWYRPADGGGPALPEGFQFRVRYWIPSAPIGGAEDLAFEIEAGAVAREGPYSLSPRANPGFVQSGDTMTLEAAHSMEVARINLADWLNLSRPGIYAVGLSIPGEEADEPRGFTPELWFAIGTRGD
jgi:hypothetical protein